VVGLREGGEDTELLLEVVLPDLDDGGILFKECLHGALPLFILTIRGLRVALRMSFIMHGDAICFYDYNL
jgi:hypothetical protein